MNQDTRDAADRLMDAIEDAGGDVTEFDIVEYRRGMYPSDPGAADANVVMGAEVTMTCYIRFEQPDDTENRFRVK